MVPMVKKNAINNAFAGIHKTDPAAIGGGGNRTPVLKGDQKASTSLVRSYLFNPILLNRQPA